MRKFIYFLVLLLLASCSSNKRTLSSRKKLEKDECQTMAETKSEFIRGYGIGTSPDMMLARDIAAMNARNDIASSIEAGVMSFLKRYSNQHTETQVDGGRQSRTDASIDRQRGRRNKTDRRSVYKSTTHSHFYIKNDSYEYRYENHTTDSYKINPLVFGLTTNIGFEYQCARIGMQMDYPLTAYTTSKDEIANPTLSLTLGFRSWGNKNFVRRSKIKSIPQTNYQIGTLQAKTIVKKTVIKKAGETTGSQNTATVEKTEDVTSANNIINPVITTQTVQTTPTTLSRKKLQFGAKVGLNISDVIGMKESEGKQMVPGYHIGLLAEYAISNLFAISPELVFSSQGYKISLNKDEAKYKETATFNYINIPVIAKFYVLKNLSLEIGPQFGFLVGASYKSQYEYKGKKEKENESIQSKYRNVFDLGLGMGAT